MIVGPEPLGCMISNLIRVFPVALGQPFVANSPVETFDVSILLRLARLNVLEGNTRLLSPVLNSATDVFRAVVATNC